MGRFTALFLGTLVLVAVGETTGGDSSTHTITIKVQRGNEIAVARESIPLIISAVLSNQKPSTTKDIGLRWMNGRSGKKITVTMSGVSPNCTLRVQAENCTGGIAAGPVPLTSFDRDFITSMSTIKGRCNLNYSVDTLTSVKTESEIHTVMYTITDVF